MVAKEELNKELSQQNIKTISLTSLRFNWYQCDEKVTWFIYVKQIVRESIRLDFFEESCVVYFKTSDKSLHCVHNATLNDLFQCKIELNDKVNPTKSSYKLTNTSIEVNFSKNINKNWISLIKEEKIEQHKKFTIQVQNRSTSSSRSPSPSPQPIPEQESVSNNYGYIGLANLGNTCYMNAAIQFLSNATDLRDYFFNKEIFQKELNLKNALGLNGKMAIQFAMLIRRLWTAESNFVIPNQLRELICSKYSNFRGYEQQDTQEFMSSLLSLIHEDLNRVQKKPFYEDSLECQNDTIEECFKVADKSWQRFLSRENSVIVDNFYGQFKSKLTCPECQRSSITFEPFNNILVPLAKSKIRINFFKVQENEILYSEWYFNEDDTVESFIQSIKSASNLKNKEIKLYVIERCNETDDEDLIGFKFDSYYDNLKPNDKMPLLGKNKNILMLIRGFVREPYFEIRIEQTCKYPILNDIDPKVCSFCSTMEPNLDKTLPRCTRCFRSAYCNLECQKKDWNKHNQTVCKKQSDRIGLPIVLFFDQNELESDQFTQKLKESIVQEALKSVKLKNFDLNKISIFDLEILDMSSTSSYPVYKKIDPATIPTMIKISKSYIKFFLKWNNSILNRSIQSSFDFSNDFLQYNSDIELNDCLKLFTQPEKLTSDNPWYCSKCKKHQEATKQMNIWKLPKYLIITLKRFQAKKMFDTSSELLMNSRLSYLLQNRVVYNKIDDFVNFPLSGLNMTEFIVNSDKQNEIYDLCSVINHLGTSLSIGHYTAIARTHDKTDTIKNELDWRLFDDQIVRSLKSTSQIISKDAYVLMYRLRSASNELNGSIDKSDLEISSESAGEDEFCDLESEESFQMEKNAYTNLNEID